jgi:hypothetical protein
MDSAPDSLDQVGFRRYFPPFDIKDSYKYFLDCFQYIHLASLKIKDHLLTVPGKWSA